MQVVMLRVRGTKTSQSGADVRCVWILFRSINVVEPRNTMSG
jgi:hypothetical protein